MSDLLNEAQIADMQNELIASTPATFQAESYSVCVVTPAGGERLKDDVVGLIVKIKDSPAQVLIVFPDKPSVDFLSHVLKNKGEEVWKERKIITL